jgi:hypothetical protein
MAISHDYFSSGCSLNNAKEFRVIRKTIEAGERQDRRGRFSKATLPVCMCEAVSMRRMGMRRQQSPLFWAIERES